MALEGNRIAAPEGASAECGPVNLEYLMLYSARQLRTGSERQLRAVSAGRLRTVSPRRIRVVAAGQLRTVSAQVRPAVVSAKAAKAATAPNGERRYDLYDATKSKKMRACLALGLTQPRIGRKTDR
jgi:hypothetical protein